MVSIVSDLLYMLQRRDTEQIRDRAVAALGWRTAAVRGTAIVSGATSQNFDEVAVTARENERGSKGAATVVAIWWTAKSSRGWQSLSLEKVS